MENKLKIYNKKTLIPEKLQPILWSKNINNLDPEIDKIYIIHQVLAYGSMDDINYYVKNYRRKPLFSRHYKN